MKAVVIALALIATGAVLYHANQSSNVDVDELWSAWKFQHNKAYSATEESLRRSIFESNFRMIEAHNADETQTFKMALNKFADLTGEEFKDAVRCMDKSSGPADEYCPSAVNCKQLPTTSQTTFDWRKKGAVTAIKNQGQCGSCWAFSTTGSLEGLYYLNHNTLLSFSEQQLVDCADSCYGCNGCWPYVAMEYSAAHGMALESLYPYKAVQGTCNIPKNITLIKTNTGYECVTQKSVDQMQAAVVQQPVSIAVEADQNSFQFYSSGTITSGCGDALDHAILIVGFDLSDSDKGYWIVKNSWGADWGMNGYLQIGASSKSNQGYGVCGILRCGTIPTNN